MMASVPLEQRLSYGASERAEPLVPGNVKPSPGAGEQRASKANTLSVRHTDHPSVIVGSFAPRLPLELTTGPARAVPSTNAQGTSVRGTWWPKVASIGSVEPRADRPVDHVVRLPDPTSLGYWYDVRQQWEGVVTSIGGDEFSVVLRDLVREDALEYEAVLSAEEISEDDLPLLKEGAVLYWTIGYKTRAGTRERVSTIRFRRLPTWSRADIARTQKRAHEFDDLFKSE
jgi:hypothetical protein